MNELLAIILIVLLCCFLFFAWLFALATCPDRMVNLISGTKQSSSSPMSRASEDLLAGDSGKADGDGEDDAEKGSDKRALVNSQKGKGRPGGGLIRSRSIPANRSSGLLAQLNAEKRANSKKLSVVPEADEQLTVTSISQCLRPFIMGTPRSPTNKEKEPPPPPQTVAVLSPVKTVLLNRNPSNCSAVSNADEKKGEEEMSAKKGGKVKLVDETKKSEPESSVEENHKRQSRDNEDTRSLSSLEEGRQDSDDDDDDDEGQSPEKKVLARRSAPPAIQIV